MEASIADGCESDAVAPHARTSAAAHFAQLSQQTARFLEAEGSGRSKRKCRYRLGSKRKSWMAEMEEEESANWQFCPRTGTLLEFDSAKGVAKCPLCRYQCPLSEFEEKKIVRRSDLKALWRKYNLEPLVNPEAEEDKRKSGKLRERATVDEECTKCGHRGLEYYTMQLRSADEGQTVFYECPKCGHKYSQNN